MINIQTQGSLNHKRMEAEKYQILMFPWLAFGHMIPFFQLSKQLAAKGFSVSFVSTPRNLERLPPLPSHKMKLVEIKMPLVEGLPQNCEATVDLQNEEVPLLKTAYDKLALPFRHLLQKLRPHLIVLDFAPHWIIEIAAELGIHTAFFSVLSAATLAYLGPPADLKLVKPPLKEGTADMRNAHVPDASGVSSGQRIGTILCDCSFVLVRSCYEFEEENLRKLQHLYQKPVLPIGLLPPTPQQLTRNASMSSTWQWLDGQKPKSVVFVGFGSEYKMPLDQIHEIAFSLELSGLPFIWILRKPQGVESSELLPPGFVENSARQGVVVVGWAPQQEILAHPAIGGCLFHSGWGTAVEALGHGHPLVLVPMVSDQGLTAKLLVEKQVGYEVPRREDGSFTRDMVAKSIRRVVVEEEGQQLRVKAAQMATVFGNHEIQESYINKFIQHLNEHHHANGDIQL